MSFYIDTSVIVAAVSLEARTGDAQVWLKTHKAQRLVVSDWVTMEVSAALSAKVWRGDMSPTDQAVSLAQYRKMVASLFTVESIPPILFRTAAQMMDRQYTGVRSGDMFHIAICVSNRHDLYTFDGGQADAARQFGVQVTTFQLPS